MHAMDITWYYYSAVLLMPLIILYMIYKLKCKIRRRRRFTAPTNWPVIGMLPGVLQNAGRIHDYIADVLEEVGGTFEFKGPWFADMDMLVTSDPANINHILSKNFNNYPKGPRFRKIFEILGQGVFNVDSELWQLHRKATLSLMNHSQFLALLEKNVWEKVGNGLLPVLDFYAEKGTHFDLQEIFQRFSFDSIILLLLDKDPATLSINFPQDDPMEMAFKDAVDAILYRHVLPESFWKLQQWIGVGREKKYTQACHAFDQFLHSIIVERQNEMASKNEEEEDCSKFSVFTSYEKMNSSSSSSSLQFLRDTFVNLIFAGRDTTSVALTWLFWLLAQNPRVQSKIRDEIIAANLFHDDDDNNKFFKVEECGKLVYLHAALCESLRLFPSVPLNHKVPTETDDLPTGHRVKANTKVILSFYSTGRMRAIWGEDYMEFKPERWISETKTMSGGIGIKHVPSYKFPAFNAGPRTCAGKDMSFIVMKMVATTVLHHYHFKLMESHPVFPSDSVVLQAKHGLKVQIFTK